MSRRAGWMGIAAIFLFMLFLLQVPDPFFNLIINVVKVVGLFVLGLFVTVLVGSELFSRFDAEEIDKEYRDDDR